MLTFDNPGDCYYVQLLRRQTDDPKVDGVPDPAYHGNMHSRSIKDYFISSLEHFDRVRPEIIELCNMFNVRAYIRLNKRTYKSISLAMLKHIAEQVASGESYSSPFHMVASAAGKANASGSAKTWIVDIDAEYVEYMGSIMDAITRCAPNPTKDSMRVVPTKSGKHIIVTPFNLKALSDWWAWEHPGVKMFDVHKDNPTILYVK